MKLVGEQARLQDVKKPAPDEFEWIARFAFKLSIQTVPIAEHDASGLVL